MRRLGLAYTRKAGVLSVGSTLGLCQAPDNTPFSVGLFGVLLERRRLEHSAPSAVQPRRRPLSALHEVRFRMSGG
jgi:hypothetical protein